MGRFTKTDPLVVARLIKFMREKYGIPPLITLEQAYQIAIRYLGEQMQGRIKLTSTLPANIYNREQLKGAWVVRVPSQGPMFVLGAGRIICISRNTGKILYDGSDGEE